MSAASTTPCLNHMRVRQRLHTCTLHHCMYASITATSVINSCLQTSSSAFEALYTALHTTRISSNTILQLACRGNCTRVGSGRPLLGCMLAGQDCRRYHRPPNTIHISWRCLAVRLRLFLAGFTMRLESSLCQKNHSRAPALILALHGLGQLGLVSSDVFGPGLDGALVAHPDVLCHLSNARQIFSTKA